MLTKLGVIGEAVHLDAKAASQLVQAGGIQNVFQWTEAGALWETIYSQGRHCNVT